jgi:hypothetical protein
MARQKLTHEHRSLSFRIHAGTGRTAKYSPPIVARRGPILFLVEPVRAVTKASIARFRAFLEQHSPEIVFVLVCASAKIPEVPQDAYDEIYAESEIPKMTRRIRTQDPKGIVRPFEKPYMGRSLPETR